MTSLPQTEAPPLGDVSTRRLVALMAEAWRTGQRPAPLRRRGADLDHVRVELRRREFVGVGVDR